MTPSRPDHEFLDPEEWESWGALMKLHRSVLQELDVELRGHHGLAVIEFDVLITLFNAPEHRLRMSELAERVLLSPAGTTHLVTRLERDGLVRREVDPADGRKWFTVLTEGGDSALKAARPTHNLVLRRTLLDATSPSDRRTLRRVWKRLSTHASNPLMAGPGPAASSSPTTSPRRSPSIRS
ncbi:MAG: transcriptional regulator, MarR family [Marmoricola sp.]|nr:transcriptional regulator, MarR family [Marmoricola sp.]